MIICNTDSLKRTNRGRVLKDIFDSGSISRKQISSNLSLTPATVTNIANFLLRNHLIDEVGVQKEIRSGPMARLLKVSQNQYFICAVHVGRSVLKLGVTTLSGEIHSYTFLPIQRCSAHEIKNKIVEYVKQTQKKLGLTILGVGVCISEGTSTREQTISPAHVGLNNYPLEEYLEKELGIPVMIDGLLPAMAEEAILFSRRNIPKSSVIIYDGAILGLCSTYDSFVLRGSNNLAGALYQYRLNDNVSIEDEVCIPQIIRRNFVDMATKNSMDLQKKNEDITVEQFSAYWKRIMAQYAEGDSTIGTIVNRRYEAIAQLLVDVTILLDPERILIKSIYSDNGQEKQELSRILASYKRRMGKFNRPFPDISFEIVEREFSIKSASAIMLKRLLAMDACFDGYWEETL